MHGRLERKGGKESMLRIEHFSKRYKGGKKAVDDLNLFVEAGDIYGFIGHNGAGKSTTIKSVAGVLEFEEGTITIDGIDIKENPFACKKCMAYIPDNPDLYEHLTGIQYLNFIGDIFEVEASVRKERIQRYGDQFALAGALGIISALIHEPKLMILDEPFVGLDPKATLLLKNTMHEMCQRGAAIFFSTHVLDVAEKLCNNVAIIKDGKLVVSGEMESILKDASLEHLFMEVTEHEK